MRTLTDIIPCYFDLENPAGTQKRESKRGARGHSVFFPLSLLSSVSSSQDSSASSPDLTSGTLSWIQIEQKERLCVASLHPPLLLSLVSVKAPCPTRAPSLSLDHLVRGQPFCKTTQSWFGDCIPFGAQSFPLSFCPFLSRFAQYPDLGKGRDSDRLKPHSRR